MCDKSISRKKIEEEVFKTIENRVTHNVPFTVMDIYKDVMDNKSLAPIVYKDVRAAVSKAWKAYSLLDWSPFEGALGLEGYSRTIIEVYMPGGNTTIAYLYHPYFMDKIDYSQEDRSQSIEDSDYTCKCKADCSKKDKSPVKESDHKCKRKEDCFKKAKQPQKDSSRLFSSICMDTKALLKNKAIDAANNVLYVILTTSFKLSEKIKRM